jgi:hypothetical protein
LSTKSCWRSAAPAALVALVALPQGALRAQRAVDVQGQGLAVVGSTTFLGAGVGVGATAGLGTRLSIVAAGGRLERAGTAARAEAVVAYHLRTPGRPAPALYLGTGVGITAADGGLAEHLVLVLGLETAGGSRGSWFVETGVGAGVRISVGYRHTAWRRTPRR